MLVSAVCPKCSHRNITVEGVPVICKCGSRFVPTATRPTKINPNAWVRWVRLLRSRDDKGVGDTVKRILATFGGERFKAFATRVGIPCKCAERQAEWNKLWPY